MEIIDSKKFRTKAKGELFGGFLFYGEEEYLKHNAITVARQSIFGTENTADTFNHIRLDADSYSLEALEDAISALPVFSDKKLIEIHSLPLKQYKDKATEDLVSALSALKDSTDTVLILYTVPEEFNAGEPKRPSKQFKALSEVLTPVYFEKQTRDKLAKWVSAHFAHEGVTCTLDRSYMLMDSCGTDMYTLAGEVRKLSAYLLANGKKALEPEDIELLASRNKEVGSFDFTNAILARDKEKAFYILSMYEAKDKSCSEVNITLGSIIQTFRLLYRIAVLAGAGLNDKEIAAELSLNEYRCSIMRKALGSRTESDLEHILELCCEADALIKRNNYNGYIILSRLIIEAIG